MSLDRTIADFDIVQFIPWSIQVGPLAFSIGMRGKFLIMEGGVVRERWRPICFGLYYRTWGKSYKKTKEFVDGEGLKLTKDELVIIDNMFKTHQRNQPVEPEQITELLDIMTGKIDSKPETVPLHEHTEEVI